MNPERLLSRRARSSVLALAIAVLAACGGSQEPARDASSPPADAKSEARAEKGAPVTFPSAAGTAKASVRMQRTYPDSPRTPLCQLYAIKREKRRPACGRGRAG